MKRMKNTLKALEDAKALINDARRDIREGDLEMADMQLDVVVRELGSCIREQLEYDSEAVFIEGRMRGISDLERRLDSVFSATQQQEENIFSSPKDQLEAGECNLTQEVK